MLSPIQHEWMVSCIVARFFKEHVSVDEALHVLLGTHFLEFLRVVDERPDYQAELPEYVKAIQRAFTQSELRNHLDTLGRLGPLLHAPQDGLLELLEVCDMVQEDPVRAAEDILLVGRMCELLLEEAGRRRRGE